MKTEIYQKQPTRFTQWGGALPNQVALIPDVEISAGMAKRLLAHAKARMNEAGFGDFAKDADVTVYSMDGDEKAADRSYSVRFNSRYGPGYIEVIGILTKNGWPSLDHGFAIND